MTIPVVAHSMTPVYIAQSKGFFADEKLDLDITSTGGGGPDIRALIAGDVEFSFTTGDNVILAHQEGKRLLMVMSALHRVFINWAMHKEVAQAKGVSESMPLAEKIKMLKGLTGGVTNPGALTAHLAAFVIRKAGYNPQQDVKIIPIGAGPTWLAALENRKVDVALTAPPGNPSRAFHAVWAYWLISSAGFSAHARGQTANNTPSRTAAARLRDALTTEVMRKIRTRNARTIVVPSEPAA